MKDALIGFTGFVGSTLAQARNFAFCFNSKNIAEIDGQDFDTVVSAGVSAVKWLANKEPAADLYAIRSLIAHLDTIRAKHFILISTIDVYRDPVDVDEGNTPPTEGLNPYGLHRLMLERFVAERFACTTIVRLPGLFGVGLRKNVIFDMLHANQTDNISPAGVLQWYPMRRFPQDLSRITAAGVTLINVTAEPVATAAIRNRYFPQVKIGGPELFAPRYDVRTRHPAVLGGTVGYHLDAAAVMRELGLFIAAERASV